VGRNQTTVCLSMKWGAVQACVVVERSGQSHEEPT